MLYLCALMSDLKNSRQISHYKTALPAMNNLSATTRHNNQCMYLTKRSIIVRKRIGRYEQYVNTFSDAPVSLNLFC